jgi:hypothetical protein
VSFICRTTRRELTAPIVAIVPHNVTMNPEPAARFARFHRVARMIASMLPELNAVGRLRSRWPTAGKSSEPSTRLSRTRILLGRLGAKDPGNHLFPFVHILGFPDFGVFQAGDSADKQKRHHRVAGRFPAGHFD